MYNYRSSTETIVATTAQTITHDKGMPSDGPLRRFTVVNTGTNNSIAGSGVDSYVMKLNSYELVRCSPAQLRALLEALIGPIGGTVPATGDLNWTFPWDLYVPSGEIGLPTGKPSMEINLNAANSSAGTSRLGWLYAERAPSFVPRFVRQQMDIGASASGLPFDIKTGKGKKVLGFCLPMVSATGITRIRLVRRNPETGQDQQIFYGERADILESQRHYNPEAITNPFFWKPPVLVDYPEGSVLETWTGAASATTDEIVPLVLEPVGGA